MTYTSQENIMCAIESLFDRYQDKKDSLDKEALNDLIKKNIIIKKLEDKVKEKNIELAKLSVANLSL